MPRITEYVGKLGVKSTEADWIRFKHPRPGDLIRWPNGKLGMVDAMYDPEGSWAKEGELHAIATCGSAFLGWSDAKRRAYVDISGGPFLCVKVADLEPEGGTHNAHFWNWGENTPGADMGVDYYLPRPVFRYIGDYDGYEIRDPHVNEFPSPHGDDTVCAKCEKFNYYPRPQRRVA